MSRNKSDKTGLIKDIQETISIKEISKIKMFIYFELNFRDNLIQQGLDAKSININWIIHFQFI